MFFSSAITLPSQILINHDDGHEVKKPLVGRPHLGMSRRTSVVSALYPCSGGGQQPARLRLRRRDARGSLQRPLWPGKKVWTSRRCLATASSSSTPPRVDGILDEPVHAAGGVLGYGEELEPQPAHSPPPASSTVGALQESLDGAGQGAVLVPPDARLELPK